MLIHNMYEFTKKSENEFGIFGHSAYYGTDMYVSKKTKNVYQIDYAFDVYALIKASQGAKADQEESYGYCMIIDLFVCCESDANEICRFISEYVNDFEQNVKAHMLDQVYAFEQEEE